jgi:hypothetical protein
MAVLNPYARLAEASATAQTKLEVIDGIAKNLDASDGGKRIADAVQFLRRFVSLAGKVFTKLAEKSSDESKPEQPD